jgi:hypothetical protein
MLPRFFHRSRREAMEVAAAVKPAEAAPRREVVTPVRPARPAAAEKVGALESLASRQAAVQPAELELDLTQERDWAQPPPAPVEAAPPPPPAPRDTTEPITGNLFRFHVTVSRRFLEKLEAARAALSHARPGANGEEILEAGLDLVLAEYAKRKGLVAKPRKVPPPAKPDHVPAHVKRAVWARAGGRCEWPLDSGGVCGSTLRLEFDHIQPRARGGPSTVENVRVACAVHNQLAARLAFGDEWMDQFTRKGKLREAAGIPSPP